MLDLVKVPTSGDAQGTSFANNADDGGHAPTYGRGSTYQGLTEKHVKLEPECRENAVSYEQEHVRTHVYSLDPQPNQISEVPSG